jgi:hypothetical protein
MFVYKLLYFSCNYKLHVHVQCIAPHNKLILISDNTAYMLRHHFKNINFDPTGVRTYVYTVMPWYAVPSL